MEFSKSNIIIIISQIEIYKIRLIVTGEQRFTVNGPGNGQRHRRVVRTHVTGNGQSSFEHAGRSGRVHQVSFQKKKKKMIVKFVIYKTKQKKNALFLAYRIVRRKNISIRSVITYKLYRRPKKNNIYSIVHQLFMTTYNYY